ncbi:MAG: 3-oxoacyl-ACP reductase [Salinisphaeraceae bacterium]|jgi:NAD(P)-dependent dehydrogenase (short-subunit alcohol dehydrogenase family)|nr:3-oxoacyl-ACP reductase [Salinisphaeraceae bacterium]
MAEAQASFSFEGCVAVVTGGTRGIGAMMTEGLVAAGATVYVTARSAAACDQISEQYGGRVRAAPFDLSGLPGCEAFAEYLSERETGIDILVNNAGATWGARLGEFPESGWDKVMDLNVKSMFFLTQALLPLLRAAARNAGRGRVINVGSIDGLTVPRRDNIGYAASKAAVHQMTRVLASELVSDGITVNAIAPGPFESKMTAYMLNDPDHREAVTRQIPMGRIGTADDMAGLTCFLCSSAADYITGTVIPLDGGYVALR